MTAFFLCNLLLGFRVENNASTNFCSFFQNNITFERNYAIAFLSFPGNSDGGDTVWTSDAFWQRKLKYDWVSDFAGAANSIFRWESRYPGYKRIRLCEVGWGSWRPTSVAVSGGLNRSQALVQYKGLHFRYCPDGGVESIYELGMIYVE